MPAGQPGRTCIRTAPGALGRGPHRTCESDSPWHRDGEARVQPHTAKILGVPWSKMGRKQSARGVLKESGRLRGAEQGQAAKGSGKNRQRAKKERGLVKAKRRECERSRNWETVQVAQPGQGEASKPVLPYHLSQPVRPSPSAGRPCPVSTRLWASASSLMSRDDSHSLHWGHVRTG